MNVVIEKILRQRKNCSSLLIKYAIEILNNNRYDILNLIFAKKDISKPLKFLSSIYHLFNKIFAFVVFRYFIVDCLDWSQIINCNTHIRKKYRTQLLLEIQPRERSDLIIFQVDQLKKYYVEQKMTSRETLNAYIRANGKDASKVWSTIKEIIAEVRILCE